MELGQRKQSDDLEKDKEMKVYTITEALSYFSSNLDKTVSTFIYKSNNGTKKYSGPVIQASRICLELLITFQIMIRVLFKLANLKLIKKNIMTIALCAFTMTSTKEREYD